jgi:Txe/YoeB family toxin of Txe-Axe toxin-antitoxin module
MTGKKYLDKEEQKLIESLDRDNWKSTKKLEDWKTVLSNTSATLLKEPSDYKLV